MRRHRAQRLAVVAVVLVAMVGTAAVFVSSRANDEESIYVDTEGNGLPRLVPAVLDDTVVPGLVHEYEGVAGQSLWHLEVWTDGDLHDSTTGQLVGVVRQMNVAHSTHSEPLVVTQREPVVVTTSMAHGNQLVVVGRGMHEQQVIAQHERVSSKPAAAFDPGWQLVYTGAVWTGPGVGDRMPEALFADAERGAAVQELRCCADGSRSWPPPVELVLVSNVEPERHWLLAAFGAMPTTIGERQGFVLERPIDGQRMDDITPRSRSIEPFAATLTSLVWWQDGAVVWVGGGSPDTVRAVAENLRRVEEDEWRAYVEKANGGRVDVVTPDSPGSTAPPMTQALPPGPEPGGG